MEPAAHVGEAIFDSRREEEPPLVPPAADLPGRCFASTLLDIIRDGGGIGAKAGGAEGLCLRNGILASRGSRTAGRSGDPVAVWAASVVAHGACGKSEGVAQSVEQRTFNP